MKQLVLMMLSFLILIPSAHSGEFDAYELMLAPTIMLLQCDDVEYFDGGWTAHCERLPREGQAVMSLTHLGPGAKKPPIARPFLAPVVQRKGQWNWSKTRQMGIPIPQGEVRSVLNFLELWIPPSVPISRDDVDRFIAWLSHSSEFVRRLGAESILRQKELVRPFIRSSHVSRIGNILIEPGWPDMHRAKLMEIYSSLGGPHVIKWLARHLVRDLPQRLRIRAALILARSGSKSAIRGLSRCIRGSSGLLKRICQRRLAATLQNQKAQSD